MAGLFIAYIAEAIAAEYCTGLNHHAIAQARAGVDGHIRMQLTIIPDDHFGADHTSGSDR